MRNAATVSRSSTRTPLAARRVTSASSLLAAVLVGNPPRRMVFRRPSAVGTSTA
ncbi:MAG: hypothetical protein M3Q47_07200 [Actinomycetota bacterium]|nr:hypothetical protein [Actinomycetota bacterium]